MVTFWTKSFPLQRGQECAPCVISYQAAYMVTGVLMGERQQLYVICDGCSMICQGYCCCVIYGVGCCVGDGDCCFVVVIIIVLSNLGSLPIITDIITSKAVIILQECCIYNHWLQILRRVCGSACSGTLQDHRSLINKRSVLYSLLPSDQRMDTGR